MTTMISKSFPLALLLLRQARRLLMMMTKTMTMSVAWRVR